MNNNKSWEELLDLTEDDAITITPPSQQHHYQNKHKNTTNTFSLNRCPTTTTTPPPPNTRPSPTTRTIPGPAGAVQAAMHLRRSHDSMGIEPVPTQEYIRRAVEDGADDLEFSSDPWLFAVDFVRSRGLADRDGAIGIPLSAAKDRSVVERVPQIVAIVKCCTPNGLGDMMATLKDPTGTINASIHRKVLTETEFGKDIVVGAVMILQKVAIFSPSRSAFCLNITPRNVLKVISKDGRTPLTQSCPVSSTNSAAPEWDGSLTMPPKSFSSSPPKTLGVINSLRRNPDVTETAHKHQRIEPENRAKNISCHIIESSRNQSVVAGPNHQLIAHGEDNGVKVNIPAENQVINKDKVLHKLNPSNSGGRCNILEGTEPHSAPVDITKNQNSESRDGLNKSQMPSGRIPIPQWTDEQLDKLFDFD